MKAGKFRVHLPYECLFDLRWGFIRKHSGLTDLELFSRFDPYCSRLTDNLQQLFPTLTQKFKVDPEVVKLSPRTAILTVVTNAYRQYAAEYPDNKITLHITLDFASVPFIPTERRKLIADTLTQSLSGSNFGVHAIHTCSGYQQYTVKQLRKNFNAVIVYSIEDFITHYNTATKEAYHGIGIITRPFFVDGKTPEQFHRFVSGYDKVNPLTGAKLQEGDHYDILSDAFAHIGPIYFHTPEYFSAILPK